MHKELYRAFLVRCWEEQRTVSEQGSRWRFSIETVGREKRQRSFVRLEDLFTYLKGQVECEGKVE